MRDSSVIAAAIVVGSVIIATGLYAGLRGGGPALEPSPTTLNTLRPSPPIERVVAPPVEASREDLTTAVAQRALEARKASLTELCWRPALLRAPAPATSRYRYAVSFNAQGKQIAQGISEIRDASRSDVAECLRAQPMDLVIPPPGVIVSAEVWLVFP